MLICCCLIAQSYPFNRYSLFMKGIIQILQNTIADMKACMWMQVWCRVIKSWLTKLRHLLITLSGMWVINIFTLCVYVNLVNSYSFDYLIFTYTYKFHIRIYIHVNEMGFFLCIGSALPPLENGKLRLYSMRFCPFAQRTRLVLAHKNIQ